MKNNLLYIKNPELFKEIHPTKNEDVNLFKLTCGFGQKIWWKCESGHTFSANVANRSDGNGCPYCSSHQVCLDNCLATINPMLSSEWHLTKNENTTPFNVTSGSSKKAWWKCESGHTFYSIISDRNNGSKCPYCAGKKACIENCLQTLQPELAKEWHPTKNENTTPSDVTCGSDKKAWWLCDRGHCWLAVIKNRTKNKTKCPICNNNKTSDIERKFYYYIQLVFNNTINGHKIKNDNKREIEVDVFIPEINLAIEYDGIFYHESIKSQKRDIRKNDFLKEKQISLIRIRESGLVSIHDIEFIYDFKNKKSFKNTLIEILYYIKNNFTLNENQIKKIEEIMNVDFENHIIPKGFFVYPLKQNSLEIINPKLAKQWHPTKNGDLKPEHVSCGSDKKVWWICENKHEWVSSVNNRSKINRGTNCPICHN